MSPVPGPDNSENRTVSKLGSELFDVLKLARSNPSSPPIRYEKRSPGMMSLGKVVNRRRSEWDSQFPVERKLIPTGNSNHVVTQDLGSFRA